MSKMAYHRLKGLIKTFDQDLISKVQNCLLLFLLFNTAIYSFNLRPHGHHLPKGPLQKY